MQDYHVPITQVFEDSPLEFSKPREGENSHRLRPLTTLWTVDARTARIFLAKYLEPERQGIFRLLDLPPEIRNTIYSFALSYPLLEVQAENNDIFNSRFHISENTLYSKPGSMERGLLNYVHTNSIDDLLAIVHVNRQIYREALPIFFSVNDFQMDGLGAHVQFARMLEISDSICNPARLPLCSPDVSRLECLKRLSFEYCDYPDRGDDGDIVRALEILARASNLKHITVDARDGLWWEHDPDDASALPGMAQLLRLLNSTPSIKLNGHGGKVQTYIETTMKPRKSDATKAVVDPDIEAGKTD